MCFTKVFYHGINPNLTVVYPEKFFDYFFNVRKKIVNPPTPLPSRSPIFLWKIGAPKLKFAPVGHVNGASDVSKVFNSSLRLTAQRIQGDWFRICCIREFKFPDTLFVFIFNTFRIYIFNTFRIYIFNTFRIYIFNTFRIYHSTEFRIYIFNIE